jgi:hypothetical protein
MVNLGETLSTAAANFKQTYDTDINSMPLPEEAVIQEEVDFVTANQRPAGGANSVWNEPVLVKLPSAFTYGGGLQSWQTIVPSQLSYASLGGSNIALQDAVSFDSISGAMNSKGAFMDMAKYTLMALQKASRRQLETDLLYGSVGEGQTSLGTNSDSTTEVVTISSATWAPAIWSGFEGAPINFYHSSSKIGTGPFNIASVDIANKTITVTGVSGDITSLDNAIKVGGSGYTLDIYISNSYGSQMVGMKSILTTTSGNLFGLSTTNYSVWQPNSFDCGSAPLSLGKIEDAAALASARGGKDLDLDTLVNPVNYANLVVEASSARRFDSSYKKDKLDNGAKYLEYFGPTGLIRVVNHAFVKQGEAFMVPLENCKRVGSIDLVFDLPGYQQQNALYVPSSVFTGILLAMFTNQALFLKTPSFGVYLSNVVASSN